MGAVRFQQRKMTRRACVALAISRWRVDGRINIPGRKLPEKKVDANNIIGVVSRLVILCENMKIGISEFL
jgi:hypothetical protein